jgi:hypothetical protein
MSRETLRGHALGNVVDGKTSRVPGLNIEPRNPSNPSKSVTPEIHSGMSDQSKAGAGVGGRSNAVGVVSGGVTITQSQDAVPHKTAYAATPRQYADPAITHGNRNPNEDIPGVPSKINQLIAHQTSDERGAKISALGRLVMDQSAGCEIRRILGRK